VTAFSDLLADLEAERRFLVVLEPYDLGTLAVRPLYYSSHWFSTEPTDTPPNQEYAARLDTAYTFNRSLFQSGKLSGRSVPGNGHLILNNADGGLDDLATYAWGGRRVRVWLGGSDFALSDFGLIFDGTAASIEFGEEDITVNLRDLSYLADREMQTLTFAGTGGVEGSADLTGKRKPLPFGIVRNIAPVYLGPDTGRHIFAAGCGPIIGVLGVYDRGATLTYSATPAPGQWSVNLDTGIITLGGAFDGPVTADVIGRRYLSAASATSTTIGIGGKTFAVPAGQRLAVGARVRIARGSSNANRVAYWMDGLITAYSGTSLTVSVDGTSGAGTFTDWSISPWGTVAGLLRVVASDAGVTAFDDAALASLDAIQPASIGYWLSEGGNGLTALDALADGTGAYWGFNRSGQLSAGRINEPASPVSSYDAALQAVDIKRLATEEPTFKFTVRYRRNWASLTVEQVAAVADADKTWFSTQWRDAISTDLSVLTAYPLSKEVTIESLFDEEADAQDEADRQIDLFGVRRDYFSVTLEVQPLGIDNGDTVTIVHERYGLEAGKDLRVVDLTENMDAYEVTIGAWG
jgi:hypothetical protein